jgi:23S rRNA-/tRNA-specific pseudouridylate synthase
MYIAILDGAPPSAFGVVNAPIALEREGSPCRAVREGGAPSRTFYRVLDSCVISEPAVKGPEDPRGDAADKKNIADDVCGTDVAGIDNNVNHAATFALISISTGRTHQIRVHMAHIGCPVMGDALYGKPAPPQKDGPGLLIGRQALHATVLRFAHPRTREEMTISAPLPDDMISCVRAVQK